MVVLYFAVTVYFALTMVVLCFAVTVYFALTMVVLGFAVTVYFALTMVVLCCHCLFCSDNGCALLSLFILL